MHRRERGAALAFVLGALAVLGLLASVVIRQTRFNDSLVARNRWDAQARLIALAGIDYAMTRLDPPGTGLNLSYVTQCIDYALDNPDLTFHVRMATRGLFGRAESEGHTRLPFNGRTQARTSLLGQALDLGRLPALGLFNHEGNLVLAGNAQIHGAVMLWRGDVRKATDYKVRWNGKGIGHNGPVWDSTAPAWAWIHPDFQRAQEWVQNQLNLINGAGLDSDSDYDQGRVADFYQSDTILIADTIFGNTRIRSSKAIRVGSGAKLYHCKLLAPEIIVEDGSVLDGVLAFASGKLQLNGGSLMGGQFIARDSIRIHLSEPLEGWPVFYAQGRMIHRGRSDSSYVGALSVEKANGQGIFLSAMTDAPVFDQEIRLLLGSETSLSGFFYCGGYARAEGQVKGSLLCRNLKFQHDGTIWLGHLRNARLEGFSGSAVIPAPLLFPGFQVEALGDDLL